MIRGYPATRTLARWLRRMVGRDGSRCEAVQIVERSPDERSSSFPSEVVTVRLGPGETLTLRWRYSPPNRRHPPTWHTANGHRHGGASEGRVYDRVLEPLFARQLSAARLYMILRWAGVPNAFRRPKDRRYYLRRIAQAVDRFRQHLGERVSVAAAS